MNLAKVPSPPNWPSHGSSDKMALYASDMDTKLRAQPVQLSAPFSQHIRPHYCALRDIANQIQIPSDLKLYSIKHRKAMFLNWVAYERLHDEGILRRERFTCPLIWCRLLFDEPRKLLDHVKTCDKLGSSEYYCTEHAVIERFAVPSTHVPTLSIKLSVIVRHAIRIIRKLGSRKSKGVDAAELEAFQAVLPPGSKADYFLIDVLSKHPEVGLNDRGLGRVELSATQSRCYELLGDDLRLAGQELEPLNSATDTMDVDTRDSVKPASARSISPLDSSFDFVDSKTTTPLSPCFSDTSMARSLQYTRERSETQPTPPTRISITLANPDPLESTSAVLRESSWVAVGPQMSCFDDDMISKLANRDSAPPATFAREGIEVYSEKIVCAIDYDAELHRKASGNKVPKQFKISEQFMEGRSQLSLVEGLRQVSEILYKRSIMNLKRNPMPYEIQRFIHEMPPLGQIADKGLATLWKVFSGHLPSTLMDVYAMIHVAYVVAIVVNQKEVAEVLDDLFADIYNWSLAIKSVTDRALFVDIACRIWAVEHSNIKCPRDAISGLSGTPNQTCFTGVLAPVNGLPFPNSSKSTTLKELGIGVGSKEHDALLHVLKGGTAIHLCRQYMDILEYTGLLASERGRHLRQMQGCIESTPSSEDSTTLLYWEKSVIEPLIEFIGLEGFRPIVNNVQTLIASGVFRNFREVELKLIYDAQHCSRSAARYHSFLKEVQRLCEKASTFPLHTPFSHDTQYRTDIDITRRFLYALSQKSSVPDVTSPQTTTSTNSSNRMTNKDLPPIVTNKTEAINKDLPATPINNRVTSYSLNSSTAWSAGSASSSNLVSGSSGRSGFSGSTSVSSNSSFSFIKPSPESHNRNTFQFSPREGTFEMPTSQQRRASKSHDPVQFVTPCPRPECDEVFSGTSQKTNCSRHVSSVHEKKRHRCPFENCDQSFTRSDNLGSHQKKIHKQELNH